MLSLLFAALFLAPPAHATTRVISVETTSQRYATLESLAASCRPGIAPNGHNYPTPSDINVGAISYVVPIANSNSIGMIDPQMRLGDHCRELMGELGKVLPADLVVTRTISEAGTFIAGRCVRSVTEELVGKIGNFELVGSSAFLAEPQPNSECAN